jgi:hypothetical protein
MLSLLLMILILLEKVKRCVLYVLPDRGRD